MTVTPTRWVPTLLFCTAAALAGEEAPLRVGNALGAEHVAFVRAEVPGGMVGPAKEAAASNPRNPRGCLTPDGAVWLTDARDCVVYRISDGQARVLAGCGVKGFRDGPADRAMFDFGVGSYADAEVNSDAAGNVYASDMMNRRIRKIHQKPDGTWWVTTVVGGAPKGRRPKKGEWIPATDLDVGGASRFAVADDGTLTFANYGGIYQVKEDKATLLVPTDELAAQLKGRKALADWHVGGSHITPDGVFYWVPGGQEIFRYHTKTGKAEVVAGEGPKQADGPTLLQSGFHTVVVVYSRDASLLYTGGGDESVPRRLYGGTVRHLQKDGSFKPGKEQDRGNWRLNQPICLGPQGELYVIPGSYCWSGWLCRVKFADQ
ncbi:MAG TPA: hypothetical protein VNE39_21330 [Planctomycetota bacterium]|nr:hypothetical protein [Planctomycetota bacterium]